MLGCRKFMHLAYFPQSSIVLPISDDSPLYLPILKIPLTFPHSNDCIEYFSPVKRFRRQTSFFNVPTLQRKTESLLPHFVDHKDFNHCQKCTLSRIFQKIEIIMKYVLGMLNDAIKLMICCHVATLEGTTQLWRKKIKAQGFEIIG